MRQARLRRYVVVLTMMLGVWTLPAQAGWVALYEGVEGTSEASRGVGIIAVLPRETDGFVAFAGSARSKTPADAIEEPRNLAFARWELDGQGQIQGQKGFLAPRSGAIRAVQPTADKGHILVGDFFKPASREPRRGPPFVGSEEVAVSWIVKLDAAGNVEWGRRFDDIRPDGTRTGRHYSLQSITEAPDGGYIAIGETHPRVTDIAPGQVPDMDMWIVRLAPDGDLLWQRRYGGDEIDAGMVIRPVPSGGFIAAGMTSGRGAFATGGELWLVRVDQEGRIRWQKSYGGPIGPAARGVDVGWQLETRGSDGYVLAGTTRSFGRGGSARGDIWVMRLGPGGDIRWQYSYGGDGLETSPTLLVAGDSFLLSGYSNSFRPESPDAWHAWLLNLGRDGAIQWQKRLSPEDRGIINQFIGNLAQAQQGYLAAGFTTAFGADDHSSAGLLIKMARDGTIGPFPPNLPLSLETTDAKRRETAAVPRTIDQGTQPAQARMTSWQPERTETRVTMRYLVAPNEQPAEDREREETRYDGIPPVPPVVARYTAFIGPHDLHAADGARLDTSWAILRQDRFNNHVAGFVDPEDEANGFFDSAANRKRMRRLMRNGEIADDLASKIVEGGVTVQVTVHAGGDPHRAMILVEEVDETNGGTGFPHVAHLDCRAHACLSERPGQAVPPPSDKCWGWYRSHIYNLLASTGAQRKVTEIAGFVSGGPSERNVKVAGFTLQALPAECLGEKARNTLKTGGGCDMLSGLRCWQPLLRFTAPVAAGPKELVHWAGSLDGVAAIRLVAPQDHYVDNSGLWIEYATDKR
ncbi:hypothetical protein BXY53_1766 [Dichotomicrobium thermohalophilum]|uniref:Uncharacterized protein n=2 Tax=Dichotomicrobium thermohalophilum TaxID=933063 RepID=A0A397Q5A5_9HYPH|nr:hypothetical protein BXY53_1766 [Dichotomicrobium thermohalophilum]